MRNMNTYCILSFIVFWALVITSCVYHNEEELYPAEPCDTSNVTYRAIVLPILEHNCYECHDSSNYLAISNILLEGHENLLVQVNNGKLISAITHNGNASFMPKDRSKLPECDIAKIEKWVELGAPDN